jgi:hypothetical protein
MVDQIFEAQQVGSGGVVRRSMDDGTRFDAVNEIIARASTNSWHFVETGGQVIVLCNAGALVIHA